MRYWMIYIMDVYGYLGIALLILVENLFPPIPSEIILTFGGFMTTYTKMNLAGVILSSTAGSLFGAILLYQIGNLVSMEQLERILSGKVGQMLHFKRGDVGNAIEWFDSKGNYTVFFCRFIPIVRSVISIPAGMAHMNFSKFLLLTAFGSFLWNTLLVSLGALAGASWQKAAEYMGAYTRAASIVIIIFLIIGFFIYIKRRFLKK
ncbi:MAG: DedA family protein [Blautia sp.]